MAEQVAGLLLQIRATTELASSQLARLDSAVAKTARQSEASGARIENGFRRAESQISRSTGIMGSRLRGLAASLGVVFGGREILRLLDSSKQIEAQLRLATDATGSFGKAWEDVKRIATTTRTDLDSTARLYGNFQRNARELGITQEQAARATETVSKAFIISGASAAEATQSIRQLVQGLQSGLLRGDEFNTIMEAAPRLSRLLADSLGVPVGSLRAMAEQGKLTADELVRAFTDREFTAKLDEEFKRMPVTFGQAMTLVTNAATITFGAFDRGGQFSTALANFVTDGAKGFGDLERDAERLGLELRATFEGLGDAFDPLLQGAKAVFGLVDFDARSLASRIRPLLGEIDAMSGWVGQQGLGGRVLTGGSVGDWWNERPTRGTTLLKDFNEGYYRTLNKRIWAADPLADFGGFSRGAAAMPRVSAARAGGGSGGGARRAKLTEEDKLLKRMQESIAGNQAELGAEAIRLSEQRLKLYDREHEELLGQMRLRQEVEFELRQQALDRLKQIEARQVYFLADIYQNAFQNGTKAIWRDFKDIGLAVISQLLARFTIAKIGGGGFDLGSALSASLTAVLGFAGGGRPPVGRVSVVGERGPELFIPSVAGTIVPNGGFGGGGVSVTINAPGATAETVMMIRREIANVAPALVQAATAHSARQASRRRL